MEKIIYKLISEFTKGVDTYTHNGSTWLIFTESKQWVIELTEEKTLWYNYNFFKSVFAYASLDCVQNQHLITKWVEDNIINKVSDIHFRDARDRKQQFEDTLENGVKNTKMAHMKTCWSVEDTIENGVKETQFNSYENKSWIEGVIKGGVKETKSDDFNVSQFLCEEVIDKGVKETFRASYLNVDNVIQDGVKETKYNQSHQEPKFKEVLKNGVKTTSALDPSFSVRFIDGDENNDWEKVPNINEVIDNGIKETHREICEYKHTVEHIIQTGVKETFDCDWDVPTDLIKDVINDGVKVSGTFVGGKRQKEDVESVIGFGTKNPTD
jgi:predicted peroxiredoxin